MSKFKVGDTVRVIDSDAPQFDRVGEVVYFDPQDAAFPYNVTFGTDWPRPPFAEHHLTLADPDVHTVMDQMDTESALPQADLAPHLKRVKDMAEMEIDGEYDRGISFEDAAKMGIWELPDPVNHPAHYTSHPSGVECIEITRHMGFNTGNAFKYIWRADLKGNAIQDLEKAAFYIADEIAKRKAAQ